MQGQERGRRPPELQVRLQLRLQQRVLHGHGPGGHLHVAGAALFCAAQRAVEVGEGDGRAGVARLQGCSGTGAGGWLWAHCTCCWLGCCREQGRPGAQPQAAGAAGAGAGPNLEPIVRAAQVHHVAALQRDAAARTQLLPAQAALLLGPRHLEGLGAGGSSRPQQPRPGPSAQVAWQAANSRGHGAQLTAAQRASGGQAARLGRPPAGPQRPCRPAGCCCSWPALPLPPLCRRAQGMAGTAPRRARRSSCGRRAAAACSSPPASAGSPLRQQERQLGQRPPAKGRDEPLHVAPAMPCQPPAGRSSISSSGSSSGSSAGSSSSGSRRSNWTVARHPSKPRRCTREHARPSAPAPPASPPAEQTLRQRRATSSSSWRSRHQLQSAPSCCTRRRSCRLHSPSSASPSLALAPPAASPAGRSAGNLNAPAAPAGSARLPSWRASAVQAAGSRQQAQGRPRTLRRRQRVQRVLQHLAAAAEAAVGARELLAGPAAVVGRRAAAVAEVARARAAAEPARGTQVRRQAARLPAAPGGRLRPGWRPRQQPLRGRGASARQGAPAAGPRRRRPTCAAPGARPPPPTGRRRRRCCRRRCCCARRPAAPAAL
jgi:hypothetical protein